MKGLDDKYIEKERRPGRKLTGVKGNYKKQYDYRFCDNFVSFVILRFLCDHDLFREKGSRSAQRLTKSTTFKGKLGFIQPHSH